MERRTFLALCAAALGLAGCTEDPEPAPSSVAPTPPPPSDPDEAIRAAVAESEIGLVRAYEAAIASAPALADVLGPWLAHHQEHLARVSPGAVVASASASALPSGSASALPSGSASALPSPAGSAAGSASGSASPSEEAPVDVEVILGDLAEAERTARRQRVSACDGATDPGLARDLCLIAASEAQHAEALAALAQEAR